MGQARGLRRRLEDAAFDGALALCRCALTVALFVLVARAVLGI